MIRLIGLELIWPLICLRLPWETLRFSGDEPHTFPWGQSLNPNCSSTSALCSDRNYNGRNNFQILLITGTDQISVYPLDKGVFVQPFFLFYSQPVHLRTRLTIPQKCENLSYIQADYDLVTRWLTLWASEFLTLLARQNKLLRLAKAFLGLRDLCKTSFTRSQTTGGPSVIWVCMGNEWFEIHIRFSRIQTDTKH